MEKDVNKEEKKDKKINKHRGKKGENTGKKQGEKNEEKNLGRKYSSEEIEPGTCSLEDYCFSHKASVFSPSPYSKDDFFSSPKKLLFKNVSMNNFIQNSLNIY